MITIYYVCERRATAEEMFSLPHSVSAQNKSIQAMKNFALPHLE